MTQENKKRGRLRRLAPVLALAGAFTLAGCVDDGYGYGYNYGGGGYYGDPYYDAGFGYDGGWPSYGWYGDYYYPGNGFFIYDRGGHRHHWNGPGGNGWHGGTGAGNGGWHGAPGNGGWHGGAGNGGNHGGGTAPGGVYHSPVFGNLSPMHGGGRRH